MCCSLFLFPVAPFVLRIPLNYFNKFAVEQEIGIQQGEKGMLFCKLDFALEMVSF